MVQQIQQFIIQEPERQSSTGEDSVGFVVRRVWRHPCLPRDSLWEGALGGKLGYEPGILQLLL